MKNAIVRNVVIAAIVIVAIIGFSFFTNDEAGYTRVDTSVALQELDNDNIKEAVIDDREQRLRLTLKEEITPPGQDRATDQILTQYPVGAAESIYTRVADADTEKFDTAVNEPSFLGQMLQFMLPLVLLFAIFMFFMSRMQGGRGGLFGVGKSRAVEFNKDMPKTTFADVAGEDEAVEELNEIRDFLQNPGRYEQLGAKIPRGVLLFGPPGTGKTLLARAVAGEAGVPFYSISGSDFVEMFVGVGASRVRDLFEKAKQNAPCIVFVDEIDAVGRHRGSGTGGGHDEREQTLNQLLVEMDGFDDRETVILIAATNRPDVLDPALLRPGRFDRQVPVSLPDVRGREAILQVHAKNKPLAEEVSLQQLAKRTIGMSGADLANVLNEGALLAARIGRDKIDNEILEEASDRALGGPRRKHRVISEREKKITAYHEGGHALAAWAMEDLDPVHKVTILARGRTGGHAMLVPEDDSTLTTRNYAIARIVMALGGRAAEEYIFGEPTSGAVSDIESATKIARQMVMQWGMSAKLGAVRYERNAGGVFGHGGGDEDPIFISDEAAKAIDDEVRRIIDAAHNEAVAVLDANRDALDKVAEELLEKETLRQEDLEEIFADVEKRPRISEFDDFGGRKRATKPPIKTPVEIAQEKGEPIPERKDPFAIPLPTSRAAQQGEGGPGQAAVAPAPGPHSGLPQQSMPSYGTPPPPGWSAPGWPPHGQTQPQPQQPSGSAPTHPGYSGYPANEAPTSPPPPPVRPVNPPRSNHDEPTTALPRLGNPEKPVAAPTPGYESPTPPQSTQDTAGDVNNNDDDDTPTGRHMRIGGQPSSFTQPGPEDTGQLGGRRRREDKEDGWTPPWEK